MVAPRAQLADNFCDSPPATLRCPATHRRPRSFSPVARGVAGSCRARCCPLRAVRDLPAGHATSRAWRVSLRASGSRRCGRHCCAATPCPKMCAPHAQVANRFRDLCRQRLAARPPAVAQRLSRQSPTASRAWLAQRCPLRAARDLAVHHQQSALLARLAPVYRRLTMRPVRLCRAAMCKDARAALPSRTPFSRFSISSASLPGRPPPPNVFLATRRRGVLP